MFPELLNGMEAPRADSVWELSRFAAIDLDANDRTGRSSNKHLAERVLLEALRFCKGRQVALLLAVTTPGVERLMLRAGVDAHRLGPPVLVNGQYVLGVAINVNAKSICSLELFEAAAEGASLVRLAPTPRRNKRMQPGELECAAGALVT